MNKDFKIWGVRHSLAGDMIFALPVLNYLELKYPNSYKYWVIAKKCSQIAPLFYNHTLIDCIRVTEGKESLGSSDIEIAKKCNLILDVTPQHPDGPPATTEASCWWNHYNVYEETFRMAGFSIEEYRGMPPELQKPRLYQWFDIEKQENSIGIWPFSSYGVNSKRSPSLKWYESLIKHIYENDKTYKIYQFGAESDPEIKLDGVSVIYRRNNLSIFEQIKISLGLDVNITTNSGSGAILGAYGANQITLLTDDAPNHYKNLLAFSFLNTKDKNINLFRPGGCDNIEHKEVTNSIKFLK